MKPYQAIIFDLFNTLVHWNPEKLPTFLWGEKVLKSTNLKTYRELGEYCKLFSFEKYHRACTEVISEIIKKKSEENIEISCVERFKTILLQLNVSEPDTLDQLATKLAACHMELLANATTASQTPIQEIKKLKNGYKLGLLSNFDDAQTAHKVLKEKKLGPFFSSIIISDEVGIRKPAPDIFSIALNSLEVEARETLFVGDSWEEDIVGAAKFGMDSVWINPNRTNPEERRIKHPFKKKIFCIPSVQKLSKLIEQLT